jgi:tetratricopeptide (TPR) repeat protein
VTQKEITFVSRQEALVEIANLAARLATRAGEAPQGDLEWLANIRKALDQKKWLEKKPRNGKIWAALANVYGEAEMFSEAIDHFRTAMALDPSSITLKDIEQLANLLSRQALASQREAPRGGRETGLDKARKARLTAAEADIDEAISLLKWLMDTPSWRKNVAEKKNGASAHEAPGKTSERYSLLGSAYKRKAWISANPGSTLGQMKQAYGKACSLAEREKNSALYPKLNQLFAEVILSWDNKRKRQRTKSEIRGELETLKSELAQHSRAKDSFWDAIMCYDGQLALALLGGPLKGQTLEALAERYRDARRRASRREFASVLDQFEFLETMALKMGKKDIAGSLDQLGKALELLKREDEKAT